MKNIELMNASAGSGKTFNLTAKVVDAMRSGIPPESVMATTFTNRAAAELKERIRLQLLKSNQPEEANRINDGFIGTVNSICGRLLKEYAIEAGLSPAVQIMPDEDSANIFNISIDRVIEKYATQMEPAAQRLELTGGGNGYGGGNDWRDAVRKIVDFARSNQMTPEQLSGFAQDSWSSLETVLGKTVALDLDTELKEAMEAALGQLSSLVMQTKASREAYELLQNCHTRFQTEKQPWSDWCRLAKLKPGKAEQPIFDPVIAIADKVLKNPRLHADIKQVIIGSFDCAIEALVDYDLYKREHGMMDFIDQEAKVLDIAVNNQAFRDSMNDRIQMLMVDEFQDTSPIQLALFLALNQLAGSSVWVGDPKQAIYGFRGTDPQLMEEVVARINKSKVLSDSWRSKENLIAFTNALFSETFYKMGADKVCLNVPKEREKKAEGGVLETWHLAGSNKEDASRAVANAIRDLLARHDELKAGDIGVLCRTNDNCGKIAAQLGKTGRAGIRRPRTIAPGQGMQTCPCGAAVHEQPKRQTGPR
jgi:ATP-dependent helicase/nuclease subunit A